MLIAYVNRLGVKNVGPERKVRSVTYAPLSWGSLPKCTITLGCGHVYADVATPMGTLLRKVYRCGQCLQNSNHQV